MTAVLDGEWDLALGAIVAVGLSFSGRGDPASPKASVAW